MANQASSGSRKAKSLRSKEVRVVHIGNPTMVETTPSEFRAVVQSLTGLKRQSSPSATFDSSFASKEVDCEESSQSKMPKHEEESQFCSILGIPETAVVPQMAEESNSTNSSVDQQEICDIFTNHMMNTLDCFDGKFFSDIVSFDFMTTTSDVV